MPRRDRIDIDCASPPFDQFTSLQRLPSDRSGHGEHARHHLYVGRDKRTSTGVLVKLTSKPGLIYQQNLANEIETLSAINRDLPDSRYFPEVRDHGRLRDGRVYLTTTLFSELPLAMAIGTEPIPARLVTHLRTALEVARALMDLHRIHVYHVDLNPMNVLYRSEYGRPVIRIVDFESSYELARHSTGAFYNPPTTQGYSAPEVAHQAPDARSDVFSLGAVLYTMLAGYQWTWESDVATCIGKDREIDPDLKRILLAATDSNPDMRYPSIYEFHAALARHLEDIWPGRAW
jgi:serine/threonine protein kinase